MQPTFPWKWPAKAFGWRYFKPGFVACLFLLLCPVKVCADPAFLAPGVNPNVMIVMDNSESMLDLAYTPDTGDCHDSMGSETRGTETAAYNRTARYAGYFNNDDWYAYDPEESRFSMVSEPLYCPESSGSGYRHPKEADQELCIQLSNGSVAFRARGNILNWATASRFDILKKVLTGGKRPAGLAGTYYEPTILDCPRQDLRIVDTELFGPVLAVQRFRTEEEVLKLANDTKHGLAAGIFTRSGARQMRMSKAIRAGIVWINTYRVVSPIAEFGGVKGSGYGRESGFQAMYDYTRPKTVWVNTSDTPMANPFVMR